MPVNVDVANIGGNVSFQIYNHRNCIDSFDYHNSITNDGIISLLNNLVRNNTTYITGISIITGSVEDSEEFKFYTFSSARVVLGSTPYSEFRFYLPTGGGLVDSINGKNIIGAKLLSNDASGREIVFSQVTPSDVIPGKYEEDGSTPLKVLYPITKTGDLALMVIWRIGITSIFTDSIQ